MAQAPAAPAQGQAPAQGGGEGQFSDLLATGDQWFQVVGETLSNGGAPKEVLSAFGQVYQGFQQFLQMLQGGQQQGGAAPMEAGAAEAAPAGNMQMRG
jgi:hypothetical protein